MGAAPKLDPCCTWVLDNELVNWDDEDDLGGLVARLTALPRENEWVEFKENFQDPDEIGEYISCLANSAALAGQETGFLVWGIRDADHAIIGTRFDPSAAKRGNEDLYGSSGTRV